MRSIRAKTYFFFAIFLFLILFIKIIDLQFLRNEKLKKRAFNNKIKQIETSPARGNIYDRNGVLLVDNRPAYNLYVVPSRVLKSEKTLSILSEITKTPKDSLIEELLKNKKKMHHQIRLMNNIGLKIYSQLEEISTSLRGVIVKNEWRRHYPQHTAVHILGYLGEIKLKEELKRDLKIGDLAGKRGIEAVYDSLLQGQKGYRKELRDVQSKKVSDYDIDSWKKALKGDQLYLTIDYQLQSYIEKLFAGQSVACIVLDNSKGEVLAMVSLPDYPLEIFSRRMSHEEWNNWLNMEGKPLYNKCVLAEYPPGSVIKMASTLSALDQHIFDHRTEVYCPGGLQIGRRFFKCWKRDGHGKVDGIRAIMHSCDTYFYELAKKINLDRWHEYLSSLGLGEKTGIDLDLEKAGNLPDSQDYKKFRGSKIGRYANLMIGQGEVLTTPLQIAYYTMILANEGKKVRPHLFYKAIAPDSSVSYFKMKTDSLEIDKRNLAYIKKGMFEVVNTWGGTARKSKSEIVAFAGKTGTAQNPHGPDHGWFTCFAPYKNPEITVTIFGEHGLHGSSMAPYAKKIIEKWHDLKENN